MVNPETIAVQVVYALPQKQVLVDLRLPRGTTAGEAVLRSGLCERFAGIDPRYSRLGVFGRLCGPDTALREGDRVEIYRPLQADPKEARRRRARGGNSI
jgi:uncharacterized protein